MKRTVKCVWIAFLSVCMSICVWFGVNSSFTAKAEGLRLISDLFVANQAQLQSCVNDKNGVDIRTGLQIKASQNGSVAFKDEMAGEFVLDYLPATPTLDNAIKQLDFYFTNENGDSFAVSVEYGTETNVSVLMNDVQVGRYYLKGKCNELTNYANERGIYTQISNKNGASYLRFDPETMCVYFGSNSEDSLLIWDLSTSINDGKDIQCYFDSFEKYTVKMEFAEVLGTGELLLYEFNGFAFDKVVFVDSATPNITATFNKGIVNQLYSYEKALAYDVATGFLTPEIKICAPDGETVVSTNGTAFTPREAGIYTAKITAVNGYGKVAVKEYQFEVYGTAPQIGYSFDEAVVSECVTDTTVYIPKIIIDNGIEKNFEGKVSIYYQNVLLKVYNKVDGGFNYKVSKAGEYLLKYYYGDTLLCDKKIVATTPIYTVVGRCFEEQFSVGTIVNMNDVKVYVDEQESSFSSEVIFPDGSVYSNEVFELKQKGVYTVRLTVEINGETQIIEKEIQTKENVSNFLKASDAGLTDICYGESEITGKRGIRVDLKANGQKVVYQKQIQLSKYYNQSAIDSKGYPIATENATPFIELSLVPRTFGERPMTAIYVYLTDSNDPNNSITVKMHNDASSGWTYFLAAAGNQSLAGYEWSIRKVHENTWGFCSKYHSFKGNNSYIKASEQVIRLYYDNNEKQILTDRSSIAEGGLINDFDDTAYCRGDIWQGFTSDTVELSIVAESIAYTPASYVVYSVDGVNFAKTEKGEKINPTLQIKAEEMVGVKGAKITLPNAEAYDLFGEKIAEIRTSVYYIYNGKRYDVSIKNGAFATKKAGNYVIVYTAQDRYKNKSVKEISVNVLDSYADLTADYTEDPCENYTSHQLGKSYSIYNQIKVDNALGDYVIHTQVLLGTEIICSDVESFIPQKTGEYTIKHIILDAVGREKALSYTMEVCSHDEVIIASDIPEYYAFCYGNSYVLTDMYIYDCSTETVVQEKAEIYINGTKTNKLEFDKKVEEKDVNEQIDTVKIEYKYNGVLVKEYNVPIKTVYKYSERQFGANIIKDETIKMERFFVASDNVEIVPETTHLKFITNSAHGEATFINKLYSENMSVTFDVLKDIQNSSNVKELIVYITDVNEPTKQIKLLVSTIGGKNSLQVNDGKTYSIKGSLQGTSNDSIYLRYSNVYQSILSNEGKSVAPINSYANGLKFEGFGDEVYLSFVWSAEDTTIPATILLQNISGQALTNSKTDDGQPILFLEKECEGTFALGAQHFVPKAYAYDVLSGVNESSIKVSVWFTPLSGEKRILTDVNGVSLQGVSADKEYSIVLSEVGTYSYTYTVSDKAGKSYEAVYTCAVAIDAAPVMNVESPVSTVKQGETITVNTPQITYACESADNFYVIIICAPDGTYSHIGNGEETYTCTQKGTYILKYVAIDLYGNSAVALFTFEVK